MAASPRRKVHTSCAPPARLRPPWGMPPALPWGMPPALSAAAPADPAALPQSGEPHAAYPAPGPFGWPPTWAPPTLAHWGQLGGGVPAAATAQPGAGPPNGGCHPHAPLPPPPTCAPQEHARIETSGSGTGMNPAQVAADRTAIASSSSLPPAASFPHAGYAPRPWPRVDASPYTVPPTGRPGAAMAAATTGGLSAPTEGLRQLISSAGARPPEAGSGASRAPVAGPPAAAPRTNTEGRARVEAAFTASFIGVKTLVLLDTHGLAAVLHTSGKGNNCWAHGVLQAIAQFREAALLTGPAEGIVKMTNVLHQAAITARRVVQKLATRILKDVPRDSPALQLLANQNSTALLNLAEVAASKESMGNSSAIALLGILLGARTEVHAAHLNGATGRVEYALESVGGMRDSTTVICVGSTIGGHHFETLLPLNAGQPHFQQGLDVTLPSRNWTDSGDYNVDKLVEEGFNRLVLAGQLMTHQRSHTADHAWPSDPRSANPATIPANPHGPRPVVEGTGSPSRLPPGAPPAEPRDTPRPAAIATGRADTRLNTSSGPSPGASMGSQRATNHTHQKGRSRWGPPPVAGGQGGSGPARHTGTNPPPAAALGPGTRAAPHPGPVTAPVPVPTVADSRQTAASLAKLSEGTGDHEVAAIWRNAFKKLGKLQRRRNRPTTAASGLYPLPTTSPTLVGPAPRPAEATTGTASSPPKASAAGHQPTPADICEPASRQREHGTTMPQITSAPLTAAAPLPRSNSAPPAAVASSQPIDIVPPAAAASPPLSNSVPPAVAESPPPIDRAPPAAAAPPPQITSVPLPASGGWRTGLAITLLRRPAVGSEVASQSGAKTARPSSPLAWEEGETIPRETTDEAPSVEAAAESVGPQHALPPSPLPPASTEPRAPGTPTFDCAGHDDHEVASAVAASHMEEPLSCRMTTRSQSRRSQNPS